MGYLPFLQEPDSILDTIKSMLGPEVGDGAFDIDIITDINSVLSALNQLGVGPKGGFQITGRAETWDELIGNRKDLLSVKNYIYIKVRMMFDPPSSSYVADSLNKAADEFEWRLTVQAEGEPR